MLSALRLSEIDMLDVSAIPEERKENDSEQPLSSSAFSRFCQDRDSLILLLSFLDVRELIMLSMVNRDMFGFDYPQTWARFLKPQPAALESDATKVDATKIDATKNALTHQFKMQARLTFFSNPLARQTEYVLIT